MFAHNGKRPNVAPCTNQRNCSPALVTAETKGSVSHIAAATSGWLPSDFSPFSRPLCVEIAGEKALFHIPQVAPKSAKAWKRAVRGWWMQVWTWQCKSGDRVCVHRGEICRQNKRSHGAWSGWSENCFVTCLVSLLASGAFYKMKPTFHKRKGPEDQNKLLCSTVPQVTKYQPNAKAIVSASLNPLKSFLALWQLCVHPALHSSHNPSSKGPFQDASPTEVQTNDEEMTLMLNLLPPCPQHPYSLLLLAPQPRL